MPTYHILVRFVLKSVLAFTPKFALNAPLILSPLVALFDVVNDTKQLEYPEPLNFIVR